MVGGGAAVLCAARASNTIVASTAVTHTSSWRFQGPGGPRTVRVRPRVEVNSNDGAVEAACRGVGLTRLLSYQVAPYLADGQLRTVLTEFETPLLPIHVLHQEGRMVSARVRAF